MLKIPICSKPSDGRMDRDITSSSQMDGGDHEETAKPQTILKTPEKPPSPVMYNYRQNHVSNVMLHGVPIVSLHIDGKERLCLAQISNTLLKQFSYNEIHNRRVALGITCVQCTPVQLEILRRAGAMPISSRRCGMITKREAERLVKSFLEENIPPKLPENFFFDVRHNCGWGCRGKFEPSRYNSSRAKCIKCNFCNLYFSPNKFIFHFHRMPDSKYSHPDAANFNSWRRHLNLVPGSDGEDIANAWEDVKAMFNGGSRKRMVSSPAFNESTRPSPSTSEIKKPKLQPESPMLSKPNFGLQYQNYPIFSMPGKTYPFNPLATPSHLGLQYPLGKTDIPEEKNHHLALPHWRNPSDFMIPSYDFLWTNQFGVRQGGLTGMRPDYFSVSSPIRDFSKTGNDRQTPSETEKSSDEEENMSSLNYPIDKLKSPSQRLSAFRPVLKPNNNDMSDNDRDSEHDHNFDGSVNADNEDLDVEIDDDEEDDEYGVDIAVREESPKEIHRVYSPDTSGSNPEDLTISHQNPPSEENTETYCPDKIDEKPAIDSLPQIEDNRVEHEENDQPKEHDINSNEKSSSLNTEDLDKLSKDELQKLLQHEIDIRKQVERDICKIKEDLNDQVNKEKSQRDEIAKQLQAMKDALCGELEQERKIRFSMQHKLKEAHDALHNFSCKMLASRQCAECAFKEAAAVIPR